MNYVQILENRLRELLLADRSGKPRWCRDVVIAVVIRLRYARAGRTAELGLYGSPLWAPHRPGPLAVGSRVNVGRFIGVVERIRGADAWVSISGVGACWMPLTSL